jgi:HAD superfamily hydrolase (TIGR01509 family)
MLKPDEQVFRHVCEVTRLRPSSVLFLDDNVINVEAAVRVGFAAIRSEVCPRLEGH